MSRDSLLHAIVPTLVVIGIAATITATLLAVRALVLDLIVGPWRARRAERARPGYVDLRRCDRGSAAVAEVAALLGWTLIVLGVLVALQCERHWDRSVWAGLAIEAVGVVTVVVAGETRGGRSS